MVVPLDHPHKRTAPLRIGNPSWKDISSNNGNIRVIMKKIVEQPSTCVKRPELGLAFCIIARVRESVIAGGRTS